MILQGRRKREKKKKANQENQKISKTIGILESVPLFGPIAQQMCKGQFLYSQYSWVSIERSCALQAAVICSSAHMLVLDWSLGLIS